MLITRAQWGAAPARGTGNALGNPTGATVHWEGPGVGTRPHSQCAALVRGIQAFHQNTRGWTDIAYNLMACEHGAVFEGRGAHRGNAANGSTASNLSRYSVCALVGTGDPVTDVLKGGILDGVAYLRAESGTPLPVIDCHSDHFPTACPGPDLRAWVKGGANRPGAADRPGGSVGDAASSIPNLPPAPKPAPRPTPKPAVKAPAFPLPAGWYFGPKSGPRESVSGYYGHRDDLRKWQAQMARRGWTIAVDGLYGPGTAQTARAFQLEKRLGVDGLIGPATWAAAWAAPITN